MADRQGFEPWVRSSRTTVFKTITINHSDTYPFLLHPTYVTNPLFYSHLIFGGKREIRTLGMLITLACFLDRFLKPLGHLSIFVTSHLCNESTVLQLPNFWRKERDSNSRNAHHTRLFSRQVP